MVYVDNYRAPFRGMIMSHMTADTNDELDDMAARLGLRPEWKQYGSLIHFDVSASKRLQAITYGAQAVESRELAKIMWNNVEMNSRARRKAAKIKSDESLQCNGNEKQ